VRHRAPRTITGLGLASPSAGSGGTEFAFLQFKFDAICCCGSAVGVFAGVEPSSELRH
jgi:hypothetical protein